MLLAHINPKHHICGFFGKQKSPQIVMADGHVIKWELRKYYNDKLVLVQNSVSGCFKPSEFGTIVGLPELSRMLSMKKWSGSKGLDQFVKRQPAECRLKGVPSQTPRENRILQRGRSSSFSDITTTMKERMMVQREEIVETPKLSGVYALYIALEKPNVFGSIVRWIYPSEYTNDSYIARDPKVRRCIHEIVFDREEEMAVHLPNFPLTLLSHSSLPEAFTLVFLSSILPNFHFAPAHF